MLFRIITLVGLVISHLDFGSCIDKFQVDTLPLEWENFIQKYNKTYHLDRDLQSRYLIFKQNIEKINSHNSKQLGWEMGVNEWSDLTWDEFVTQKLMTRVPYPNDKNLGGKTPTTPEPIIKLPTSLDWRTTGMVSPVKNQGQCGSCWAFSAVSCMESLYAIKNGGEIMNFSEQQLVDCSGNYGNYGCNGGWMQNAYKYTTSNKICNEKDYSYTALDGQCKICQGVLNFKIDKSFKGEYQYLQKIQTQPIAIALYVSQEFQFYKSGIFNYNCGKTANHAVTLIGYGSSPVNYWIIKNSWGTSWGENGYIRIVRGNTMCGIGLYSSYTITM